MDGRMDRNRQKNGQTDKIINGHAIYVHRHAKNNPFPIDFAISTKALPTDGLTDGPTDQPTDRPTDRRTDGRTYPLIEMR